MNKWLWSLALGAALGCGSSGSGETTGTTSSAIAGCTGTGGDILNLLCGVGAAPDGTLGVQFAGHWFTLGFDGESWNVANDQPNVVESAVLPVDTVTEQDFGYNDCLASCDPPYSRQCAIYCGPDPTIRTRKRKFTVAIGGQIYEVEGTQQISDTRVSFLSQEARLPSDIHFTVRTPDPVDQNTWTVTLNSKRNKTGGGDQEAVNETLTAPGATSQHGGMGSLFLPSSANTYFHPDVELGSAFKSGAAGATQMIARANPALNQALATTFPTTSQFQNFQSTNAIVSAGTVLGRVANAAGDTYDLQRFTQFYLDDRRGHSGYSTTGSGERPGVDTNNREWRFHHNIVNYSVYYPFLAGICGLEAHLNAYIAGSLNYGHQSCFDGLATTVGASGRLEFAMRAGGGFGCQLIVASASAGLEAYVKAAAEFETSLSTLPPRLDASVNVYVDVGLRAYVRTRVLFWRREWGVNLYANRVFQRGGAISIGAQHPDPAIQICNLDDGATTGTCTDPLAACDVTGRCIRYDFSGGSEVPPIRVDTGACFYDTPPALRPTVKVAYLVPSDKTYQPHYRDNIEKGLRRVQAYYKSQTTNQQTFVIDEAEPVSVYQLPSDSAFYRNNGKGEWKYRFWENVKADGFWKAGTDYNKVYVFYIDADGGCGQVAGSGLDANPVHPGVTVMPSNDLRGLSGEANVPACANRPPDNGGRCRWVGGMGHEIGHAFGLDHPPGCDNDPRLPTCDTAALMDLGYASYPTTHLTATDKSRLRTKIYFKTTTAGPTIDCSNW